MQVGYRLCMDSRQGLLEQRITGLEQRIAYLERIVKVSQILNSTLSLDPLLRIIIQSATELTHTEACSIMLLDKQTGELRFAHTIGEGSADLRNLTVSLDHSIAGWIVGKGKPLLIRDVKSDPRWNARIDEAIDFDTRSILGIPLRVKDETIGVLELLNKLGDEGPSQDDIQIASTLAAQAAIAIENARSAGRIAARLQRPGRARRAQKQFCKHCLPRIADAAGRYLGLCLVST